MNTKSTNTKKIIVSFAVLLVLIAALLSVYRFTKGTVSEGGKQITVEVIHGDGSQNSFTYDTECEYLGEVLTDEKLVDGDDGPYGMFITTVDGETADDSNQEWWCITKDGSQLNTSADQTPIADKDHYELTLTIGY
ncbi:MAG: DUF4430 domain-containing protein [Lachnospiraceae bacterium]|nr:DUF4430 domain-containing protein [Lachnospiraceae bacterium]